MEKTVAEMTNDEIVEAGLAQGINPDFDLGDASAFRQFARAMNCTHLSYADADQYIKDNFPDGDDIGALLDLAQKLYNLKALDSMN